MTTQFPSLAPATPVAPRSACILVVDDDPGQLAIMREVLEEEGYIVEVATDGKVALDRLLHGPPPDLVVTDLAMPVMDGWQLIAGLKERPSLAGIPVVVLSGGEPRALKSAPVSAGYLEKPVNPARLLETLAACRARRHRRSLGVRA
jgi:CheY-like chemotaxis protein